MGWDGIGPTGRRATGGVGGGLSRRCGIGRTRFRGGRLRGRPQGRYRDEARLQRRLRSLDEVRLCVLPWFASQSLNCSVYFMLTRQPRVRISTRLFTCYCRSHVSSIRPACEQCFPGGPFQPFSPSLASLGVVGGGNNYKAAWPCSVPMAGTNIDLSILSVQRRACAHSKTCNPTCCGRAT